MAEHFGNKIKHLRTVYKYTQEEFSKRIGIKRNALSMIESNKNRPTVDIIHNIIKEFQIDANYFFEGTNFINTDVTINDIADVNLMDFDNSTSFSIQWKEKSLNQIIKNIKLVRSILYNEFNIPFDTTEFEKECNFADFHIKSKSELVDVMDIEERNIYLKQLDSTYKKLVNRFLSLFSFYRRGVNNPESVSPSQRLIDKYQRKIPLE